MPKINLYAEILTHLRQLALHAFLETEKNEKMKVDISSDKKIITVLHDGEFASLYLPTQISGNAKVISPLENGREISVRVQIDGLEQWKDADAVGIEAPWKASELSSETALKCVECEAEIVSTGTILSWKDLPNQHWADVMDLWFCHKPHDQKGGLGNDSNAAEAKGFSSQSKLASSRGLGMVDLVSFAIHPGDCNIKKTIRTENENSFKPIPVHCIQCRSQLGVFAINDNLVRLDKSAVSVKSRKDVPFMTYPPTVYIAAQLLELIESTAIRKIVVYSETTEPAFSRTEATVDEGEPRSTTSPSGQARGIDISRASQTPPQTISTKPLVAESESKEESLNRSSTTDLKPQPLLLWIFNPDIYYSSSRLSGIVPHQTTSASRDDHKVTSNPPNTTLESNSRALLPQLPPSPTPHQQPTQPSSSDPNPNPNPNPQTKHLPHRALKIFYQPFPPSQLPSILTSSTPQYEPLALTSSSLRSLTSILQHSTTFLPSTARTYNDWQIGILDRYERHSPAQKVMAMNSLTGDTAGKG